jgi:LPS export ABC transporter protein LptC
MKTENQLSFISVKMSRTLYFFIGIVLFTSCEEKIAEMQRNISQQDLGMERIETVEMLYSDSAIVRLRIQAPTLLNYIKVGEEKKVFPDGLKVDFYNENAITTSTLTAKYATQYNRQNKIVIQKKVIVESLNQEKLETEELIWDEQKKQLYTDKWVKVSTKDETIYGYGFTSNQEFTEWEINKVTGRFIVDNLPQ